LVAVGVLVAAMRAGARDVAVGQKLSRLLVIVLLRRLLDELAFVVQLREERRRRLVMFFRRRARVDVKRDAQLFKRLLDDVVVSVHDVLRRASFLAGFDGDGHAVFIATADEENLLTHRPQVARIDVGRHIYARQMSYMHRPVGIGQRRCDSVSFVLLVRVCHEIGELVNFEL